MDVTFVNPIDGPCLSLMVPVLSFPLPRAQGAPPGVPRVARRFASLVVGNMCALVIDGRALIPYAPALLPDLAACVKDCNPKMRQYGASALTALLKGMASEYLSQRFENMASSTASSAILWRRSPRCAPRGRAGPAGAHRAGGLAGDEDGPHGGGGAGRGGAAARGGGGAARR